MKKILLNCTVFLISICISEISLSEINYAIDIRIRSKPSTANIYGTMAYDRLLWGEKSVENPFYGYFRIGARGGGSPNYGAFLQFAPIAPVIFEIQKGSTHRFLKISTFDCDLVECKGKIERTDYILKILGAYKNFVFSAGATWREIQTENVNQLVALESEFFTVTSGFHRFFETVLSAGYKLPNQHIIAVMSTSGVISEGDRRYSSVYGLYRLNADLWGVTNLGFTAGIGNYKSDQADQDGFSAIFAMSYQWGEKLSLF